MRARRTRRRGKELYREDRVVDRGWLGLSLEG